jgi:hypothetical protein
VLPEQDFEKLKGKTSARKGWLLLAATADWWGSFYEGSLGTTSIPAWRRLILDQAEGLTNSDDRDRLAFLAGRFKDSCVMGHDFESAACWLHVSRALSGLRPGSLRGHAIVRGTFRFVENGLPSTDFLDLVSDLFADHLEEVRLDPAWLAWQQGTARAIAQRIYDADDFADLPVLADALQDAGCDEPIVLDHCRNRKPHVRGCWVVDWCLGKS